MRNGVVVALLFVVLLATAGTTMAGGKKDGDKIVKTLITRIDSLEKEINHLQVIIAAVKAKATVPEGVRDVIAVFPQQLDMMTSVMKSMKKEVKSGSVQLANDQSLHKQLDATSQLITTMEETLQEIRKNLQEISSLYTI